MINILNPDGTINKNGGPYAGLDRFEARKRVTEDMEKLGFFDGREDRDIELAHSDRSKTPIEPYLSDQWFVKMEHLAQTAMDAVTDGRVQILPARYAKTYLDWLGEKRDWCISRQLWYGHQIPVWYARCAESDLQRAFGKRTDVVWRQDEENDQWLLCGLEDLPPDALGPGNLLQRDPDVLDTWFSSALWPHSTLGWPGPALPGAPPGPENPEWAEMRYYYPTSALITSRDIITLWVARMVITGLYNVGDIPFHKVYIHPKILDGFGETMSKSKGNGIDPLDIIGRYGTDALRYLMVHSATETQDSRMPVANVCPHCDTLVPVKQEHMYMRTRKIACPKCKKPFRPGGPWPADDPELPTARQASEKFEMGRNFANKLWNAARFILMNLEGYRPAAFRVAELPIEDGWILSRLTAAAEAITDNLENFRFSETARAIYEFTWSEYCDWYLEMCKGRLKDDEQRPLVQRLLAGTLDAILRLVHPIMPFVAESIWQALAEAAFERGLPAPDPAVESVVIAEWPHFPEAWKDPATERRIARMQDLIRAVREIRNRYMIDPKTQLDLFVRASEPAASDLNTLTPFISTLAGVGQMACGPAVAKPPQSATAIHADFRACVSLQGLIDVPAEIARLEKQLAEKRKHLAGTNAKLASASFTDRAPPDVVQQQRDLAAELEKQIQALEGDLQDLRQG
jgi:valyl-tRNA synthetase